MDSNQANSCQIKKFILTTIKTQKPENTAQLIKKVQQAYPLPKEQIAPLLVELENEGKLHFVKNEALAIIPTTLKVYIFSNKARWFWAVIMLSVATTIAVFAIPEGAYPIAYVRSALGIVFVLFLPGFAFIKALFPSGVPIKTSSENLDVIERIALSLGLSLALVPIAGLILNYTPWGIRLAPITLSLLALTIVLTIAAILREYWYTKKFENLRETR